MREIAVIGAGAAGLVASRHLVASGLRPTIFEVGQGVGGAWRVTSSTIPNELGLFDNDDSKQQQLTTTTKTMRNSQGKMWDNLTTNLSKYTCQFSDHPWSDITSTTSSRTSMFPTATDMSHYLQDYSNRFLDPQLFRYGCHVTNISKRPDADQYTVKWTTLNDDTTKSREEETTSISTTEEKTQDFDGVVVATGFFSKSHFPKGLLQEEDGTSNDNANYFEGKIIHSSDYKTPDIFAGQTVAVIGSSFSALEIAADISKYNANNDVENPSRVISILPSIPWIVPRYVVCNDDKNNKSVLPIDIALYQRKEKQRNDDDSNNYPEQITMDLNDCRKRHLFLQGLVGKRRAKLQEQVIGIPYIPSNDNSGNDDSARLSTPKVAISDDYLDLVLDGHIEVVPGRVVKVTSKNTLHIETATSSTGPTAGNYDIKELNGIDSIIACTGYSTNLKELLESNILDVLEYDPNDKFAPITSCYDTYHPKLPGLGFVGMYRGPYFGVMELQARLLAGLWSDTIPSSSTNSDISDIGDEVALAVSRKIRSGGTDSSNLVRPQFPHYDYIGFMDTLAQRLKLSPLSFSSKEENDDSNGLKQRIIVPSLYQSNLDIVNQCQDDLEKDVLQPGQDGSLIPKIVLGALIGGTWEFDRTIRHFSGGQANQNVSGKVKFTRRMMNKNESENNDNIMEEYVRYREDGEFVLPNGKSLSVFREYDYIEDHGNLDLYFIEGGKRAHLFLSLKFGQQQNEERSNVNNNVWVATSDHLCIKDLYSAKFEVTLDGISAEDITMTYRVRGPTKDYESVTYLRPTTQE